ncbi:DUF4326 domain-containing protein [Lentzea sp. NPDC092896]|uniref:DUF4326 domain-containing protein n=1 Tax=Lentzea sp. NPDC092896 TaxID=3364127 RepID=UPI00380B2BF5
MPERIQRERTAGWKMPSNTKFVGRPTKWGNPFALNTDYGLARVPGVLSGEAWEYEGRISSDGARHDYHHPDGQITVCHVRYMTAAESVETYERLLTGNLSPSMVSAGFRLDRRQATVEYARRELAGKNLCCWCSVWESDGTRRPCHADTLLRYANPASPELLDMVAARDFIDFPTGWRLAREGVPHWTRKCSYVSENGAFLCDCDAIEVRWCELRQQLGLTVDDDQLPTQQMAVIVAGTGIQVRKESQ